MFMPLPSMVVSAPLIKGRVASGWRVWPLRFWANWMVVPVV